LVNALLAVEAQLGQDRIAELQFPEGVGLCAQSLNQPVGLGQQFEIQKSAAGQEVLDVPLDFEILRALVESLFDARLHHVDLECSLHLAR